MPTPPMPADTRDLVHAMLRQDRPRQEIAEQSGVSRRTISRMLATLEGMTRPADVEYDQRYLTHLERLEIARLLDAEHTIADIARRLGRAPSTISRELQRNRHPSSGYYLPEYAHRKAWQAQRRPKQSKLATHPVLHATVQSMLTKRLSPEQIAGRLKVLHPDDVSMHISYESIYQSLYVYPRGELTRELKAQLRSKRTTRRPHGQRHNKHSRIPGLVPISERPDEVEGRLVPGHHEGDLIKGSTVSNSAVGTIVERHSGYLTLVHLPEGHNADTVAAAVSEQMGALPAWFAKTLTWDRGGEMARHQEITRRTGIAVYFADPYSPQQRPSNENTNGLLREYMPKGTDLSVHTLADLRGIEAELNDRPRKRLGYLTPREVFANLATQQPDTGIASTP